MNETLVKILNGEMLTSSEVRDIVHEGIDGTSLKTKSYEEKHRWFTVIDQEFTIDGYPNHIFSVIYNEGNTENQEDEYEEQVAWRALVEEKEVTEVKKVYTNIPDGEHLYKG